MEEQKLLNATEEIKDLVMKFETCTLPASLWTHQAHLEVALWYLLHYSREEAKQRMHEGIFQYNIAMGGKNTDQSGYHETITLFYLEALERFLKDICKSLSFRRLVNDLIDSRYTDKNLPFEYYTKELLMSAQARREWVVPDKKKLDF
jgi:hypothetical protein